MASRPRISTLEEIRNRLTKLEAKLTVLLWGAGLIGVGHFVGCVR